MIVHDAATVFIAIIDVAAAWVEILTFTAIVIGWAGSLTGVWAVKTARNRLSARLRPEAPESDLRLLRSADRRAAPRWALPPDSTPEPRNRSGAA